MASAHHRTIFGEGCIDDIQRSTSLYKALIEHVCRRCGQSELAQHVHHALDASEKALCKTVRRKLKPDPSAPARAKSGFDLFCVDERPRLRAEQPMAKIDVIEETREIARRWKAATEDTKATYAERAKQDKARFALEMARYKDDNEKAVGGLCGPGTTVGGAGGAPAAAAASTPAAKYMQRRISKYHADAAKLALELASDIIASTCQMCSRPEMAESLCEEMLDAKTMKIAFRPPSQLDAGAIPPPKRPRSGWLLFCASDRYLDLTGAARTKRLSEEWRGSADVRDYWNKQAGGEKERYRVEKEAYDRAFAQSMNLVAKPPTVDDITDVARHDCGSAEVTTVSPTKTPSC